MIIQWLFHNLPLHIIDGYYSKHYDNLSNTQFFDIDNT
jgi:hypothetical protein